MNYLNFLSSGTRQNLLVRKSDHSLVSLVIHESDLMIFRFSPVLLFTLHFVFIYINIFLVLCCTYYKSLDINFNSVE